LHARQRIGIDQARQPDNSSFGKLTDPWGDVRRAAAIGPRPGRRKPVVSLPNGMERFRIDEVRPEGKAAMGVWNEGTRPVCEQTCGNVDVTAERRLVKRRAPSRTSNVRVSTMCKEVLDTVSVSSPRRLDQCWSCPAAPEDPG
jgi:hypothetical protein